MSRYRHYLKYRDSGVEWIGEVPEHWHIAPVYTLGILQNGYPFKSERFEREGLPEDRLVRIRDISGDDDIVFTTEQCPDDAKIRDGDVIIGMDGDFNVHRWSRGLAKLNQRMCAIRGNTNDITLLLSYCLSEPLQVINDLAYSTTVKHLSSYEVLHVRVALPALNELPAINAAIDRATARIDALIAKKTRFIELLQEKRQALITHAVTKGLDPNAKMKDSGVEWIGEVPEGWDVMPIRMAAKLKSGHTPSRNHPEYWVNCTVPWFTLADVWQIRSGDVEYVRETKEKISELGLANSSACLHPAGTVILSRTASVGFSAIMEIDMATTQDFADWICGPRLVPEFLLYVFRSMGQEFRRLVIGSTHMTIYMPDIEAFRFALPPRAEQERIVNRIRALKERLDELVRAVTRSITLLQEKRSALITAAVTGKIDVRSTT